MRLVIIVLGLFNLSWSFKFPPDFLWGVSTAAYQVEGAWNQSGKGENIWDRFIHSSPNLIKDRTNGDIAANSYHKIHTDVNLLKDLGVNFYRFSISWARILPQGLTVNQEGVDHYNKLIDLLISNNIIPFVTIYHWDLPQAIEDIGGWINPKTADFYETYADTLFRQFGDRVKYWITFNEPRYHCDGYANGQWAPGTKNEGFGNYLCMEVVLKSHARAYRLYKNNYKAKQNGLVGITMGFNWYEPFTNSSKDVEATNRMIGFDMGIGFHPIFSKSGDYPPIVRDRVNQRSKEQKLPRSRLPYLSPTDIKMIQGTYDFLGLNHYCSFQIRERNLNDSQYPVPSLDDDINIHFEFDPSWVEFEARPTLKANPIGFYKVLKWVKEEYGDFPIFITENGYADLGSIQDLKRVKYMEDYIFELSRAVAEGVNVKGYAAWSFMDNFEWISGYTQKYGLYYVNMSDPNRERIPKLSSKLYADIIKQQGVDFSYCDKNSC